MAFQERSALLLPHEIDRTYPGLRAAVSRASNVISPHFRLYRSNVESVKPPLFLADASTLNALVGKVNQGSTYEYNEIRMFAHFEPFEGVVYGAAEEIQKKLAEGRSGQQFITLVMAEEYIHAFSTVSTETGVRSGFISVTGERNPHTLFPGQIYDFSLRDITLDDIQPAEILPEDERLTENATAFAVHLLLAELLPDLRIRYPYLLFMAHKSAEVLGIMKKDASYLAPVLRSLTTGNRQHLQPIMDGKLLVALETPNLVMASVRRSQPRSIDDFFPMY